MSEKKIVKAETESKVLAPIGETAIERGSALANQLKQIILKQKLYADINGKQFVTVEGWTTLGAMIGLFPVVEEVKREFYNGEVRYIATVAIKNLNDQILGRAVGMCSSAEKMGNKPRWKDEYAIMSMAQTRATSKAFRLVASWIVALAGFETTPAEEMIGVQVEIVQDKPTKKDLKITDAQRRKLFVLMKSALSAIIQATDITDSEVEWALKQLIDLKNASRQKASTIIEHLSAVIKGLDPDNKNPEYKAAAERFIKWYNGLQIEE